MSNLVNSIYNIRLLDDLAQKDTVIHKIHPLIKLLTTVIYLTVVVSFDKYEIEKLIPFVFYPILIFTAAEIPLIPILKRLLIVAPFIIGIGILNPLFDKQLIIFEGFSISGGWITFLSLLIKGGLTVTVSILLIATTGIDKLASALRVLKIPEIFVLQLLLTYRYISVLVEEVSRMLRAYSLRAPLQKGIHRSVWGSFAGQLLLRTYDRAQRVHEAMVLRGFTGEYNAGMTSNARILDLCYLILWSLFFIIARLYNIPILIGSLIMGVIK